MKTKMMRKSDEVKTTNTIIFKPIEQLSVNK